MLTAAFSLAVSGAALVFSLGVFLSQRQNTRQLHIHSGINEIATTLAQWREEKRQHEAYLLQREERRRMRETARRGGLGHNSRGLNQRP